MGNEFQSIFNNTFGSNITHIANGYSRAPGEWIWVSFHENPLSLNNLSATISGREVPTITAEWARVSSSSLIRVAYADFHKQRRTSSSERITVISHDGRLLVQNYHIIANRSFIIDRNGSPKCQKYGGGIWVDEQDNNHRP
jgi:hypothetical protein